MKVNVATVSRALIQKAHDNNVTISNEDLALRVVAEFAKHDVTVKTTASCIAWYKSKMRKEGKIGQSASAKSIAFDIDEVEFE